MATAMVARWTTRSTRSSRARAATPVIVAIEHGKPASVAWYTYRESRYDCPDDCDPHDLECGHRTVLAQSRELLFTYADGSQGWMAPLDAETDFPSVSDS